MEFTYVLYLDSNNIILSKMINLTILIIAVITVYCQAQGLHVTIFDPREDKKSSVNRLLMNAENTDPVENDKHIQSL